MRKYFFSAMALVLGLFTVTAVLAFPLKIKDERVLQNDVYYFTNPANPESTWMQSSSWTDNPDPVPTCGTGQIPCKIDLQNNQTLTQFLQQLEADEWEYEELHLHDQITPKS